MNDGTTAIYDADGTIPATSLLHSHVLLVGNEIIAFQLSSGTISSCYTQCFWPIYRSITCTSAGVISLDLTTINGKSQILNYGATQTLAFTSTDTNLGLCGTIEYSLSYTPASGTTGLISLNASTLRTVNFAASNLPADQNAYTVTINARFVGNTATWPTSATATFTYIDTCTTTTLVQPAPALSDM